jgi:hypothetical protein
MDVRQDYLENFERMYEEEAGEPFPMEQIGDRRTELMHAIGDTIVWHFPGSRTAVARVSRL